MRRRALLAASLVLTALGCGGGGDVPEYPQPVGGFAMLSGRAVLVLPVQYVHSTADGWIGGAASERDAVKQADGEIAFALGEKRSRATWVLPDQQAETLKRRPSIEVNPYLLSVVQVRNEGSDLERITDPLYGEIRILAALFDTRYVIWPFEFYHAVTEEIGSRVAVRTLLLDARTGDVLWQGPIYGGPQSPTSAGAVASTAQAFALAVSP